MQKEALFVCAIQCINKLLIITGAQCCNNHCLSFATGEQSRTMSAGGQGANFRRDLANS